MADADLRARDWEPVDPAEWSIRDDAARTAVREATSAVASLVRSTYGPRGMATLVETVDHQDEWERVVTRDANEILAAADRADMFNHPVAALFLDSVDALDRGLSDGRTTAVLFAAELLGRGVELVERGSDPTTVVTGYALAGRRATSALEDVTRQVSADDRTLLTDVARTALPGAFDRRTEFAELVATAVGELAARTDSPRHLDTDRIKVCCRSGVETRLLRGTVVRRWPRGLEAEDDSTYDFDWRPLSERRDVGVAVVDSELDPGATATPLGGDDMTGTGSAVSVNSVADYESYAAGRDAAVADVAARLRSLGVDVLVSQPRVEHELRRALASEGVTVVDKVETPESDVDAVARATGAEVVSYLRDLTPDRVGTAGRIAERTFGREEKWTVFDRCDGPALALVVGVHTDTNRKHLQRRLTDAVEVTARAAMDGVVVPGGGATPAALADRLRAYAPSVPAAEQMAVAAYADALSTLPYVLAENAGLDPVVARANLRAAHDAGEHAACIDVETGDIVDAWAAGLAEPQRIPLLAMEAGRTVCENLLTVDAVCFPGVEFERFVPGHEHD